MPYPNLLTNGGAFTYQDRDAINALIAGQGILSQGNVWWVKPVSGSDVNDGLSPASAFQTLSKALASAAANQNDVILLCAEGHAASATTAYQSATLDWNKDLVHLIGVNNGPSYSQRARIGFVSTYAAVGNLFTLSANNCLVANVSFFMGVADATPIGCVKVTGTQNVIRNCHIAGIGNAANDIAGAYSLRLAGGIENVYEDCVIGLDTISRGANANSEVLIDTYATREEFRNCKFVSLVSSATNHPQIKIAAAGIDKTLDFYNCRFINESTNYLIAQAGVFALVAVLTRGFINLFNPITNRSDNSTAPKWDVNDRNQICVFNSPVPAADTAGVGFMV